MLTGVAAIVIHVETSSGGADETAASTPGREALVQTERPYFDDADDRERVGRGEGVGVLESREVDGRREIAVLEVQLFGPLPWS